MCSQYKVDLERIMDSFNPSSVFRTINVDLERIADNFNPPPPPPAVVATTTFNLDLERAAAAVFNPPPSRPNHDSVRVLIAPSPTCVEKIIMGVPSATIPPLLPIQYTKDNADEKSETEESIEVSDDEDEDEDQNADIESRTSSATHSLHEKVETEKNIDVEKTETGKIDSVEVMDEDEDADEYDEDDEDDIETVFCEQVSLYDAMDDDDYDVSSSTATQLQDELPSVSAEFFNSSENDELKSICMHEEEKFRRTHNIESINGLILPDKIIKNVMNDGVTFWDSLEIPDLCKEKIDFDMSYSSKSSSESSSSRSDFTISKHFNQASVYLSNAEKLKQKQLSILMLKKRLLRHRILSKIVARNDLIIRRRISEIRKEVYSYTETL